MFSYILNDLGEYLKDILANNGMPAFFNGLTLLADIFMSVGLVIFYGIPPILLGIFLTEVCLNSKSRFYWTRFKKDPFKTVSMSLAHPLLNYFALQFVRVFSWYLFLFAFMLAALPFAPEDGVNVRETMTGHNFVLAFGCFSLLTILFTVAKAACYTMLGKIRSIGEFKINMLIW